MNHLNAKRFENIDKNPWCHSGTKNRASVYFKKQVARKIEETLLPVRPYQGDYDRYAAGKEKLMPKLQVGYIDMGRYQS